MNRVDKTEAYLSTLPLTHQNMMLKYRDHLFRIRSCIGMWVETPSFCSLENEKKWVKFFLSLPCSHPDENFQIIRKLVEDVGNLFENANQSMVPQSNNHHYDDDEIRVRFQDMDKVNDMCVNKMYKFHDDAYFNRYKKNELPHSIGHTLARPPVRKFSAIFFSLSISSPVHNSFFTFCFFSLLFVYWNFQNNNNRFKWH